MSLKLACLASKWTLPLVTAAQLRGHQTMIVDPSASSSMDPGTLARAGWTLFARIDQAYPEAGRTWALAFLGAGGKCVQSREDLLCYENRAHQMGLLEGFYPPGSIIKTKEPGYISEAVATLGLPIVSKARWGSSSKTVRLLHSRAEVDAEVTEVFSTGVYFGNRLQHGECLWQAMVHHNDFALRVARVTRQYGWAFKVLNRPHDWRASGSGLCQPLAASELATDRYRYALNTFLHMADDCLESNWCAADLLYDRILGQWKVVDVTLAWNLSRNLLGGNYDAPVINLHTREPHPRGLHGRDQWEILLDDLEAGW